MTDQKHQPKPNFPKSLSDALIAGGTSGLASLAFDAPPEQAIKIAFAGGAVSLFLHWYRSVKLFEPGKKPRRGGRQIKVNTATGSRDVKMFEFQPGYVTRETWLETLRRWTFGKAQPRTPGPKVPTVTRPAELDQFVFVSHSDDGQMVEVLSNDFRNFLRRAWLYRERGKGFGARLWGPLNQGSWPDWYPGPFWYQAARNLVYSAENGLGRQLVRETSNQWCMLRWPAQKTYEHVIYWYTMRQNDYSK